MLRSVVAAASAALLITAAAPALADKPVDAAQIRQAAEQFDAGVAAYKQKDFEGAASRFEAADAAVPSPKALRQAIRARADAGQASRAATLAAQALERYPDDATTAKLARDTLAKAAPGLHKLSVSCGAPCVLAVGPRGVPGEPATSWVVYLDPGKTSVSASFLEGMGSARREVDARAGEVSEVSFEPAAPPPADRSAAAPPSPPQAPAEPAAQAPAAQASAPKGAGLPKAVFFTALGVTAAVGGVTVWSGVDTLNNPGREGVRAACAGKGEACPEYQLGLQKQARTNILIGATAGAAAVTLVLGLFTSFRGGGAPSGKGPALAPVAVVTERSALVGATGAF